MIIPKAGVHAKVAEEDVKRYLSQRKKVSPDDKGVFGSFNLQDEFDKVQGLFVGIKVFSWIVAIGTIFAGAVGVGNIMLIVVKERTREIGLRKALGATPASIIAMIMQESLFITAVAGYSGLVVGALLLEGISKMLEASGGKVELLLAPGDGFQDRDHRAGGPDCLRRARVADAGGQGRRRESDNCIARRVEQE